MTPDDRIKTINQSLSVFRRGLASLLPLVGIFPAASALVWSSRLRRQAGVNPAASYVRWGRALAIVGLLVTTLLVAAAAAHALEHTYGYGDSDGC